MARSKTFLRRFSDSLSGNMAIMFGITAPVVVGAVGLGVETGY
jgi:Flp pilus assembly protein TadG